MAGTVCLTLSWFVSGLSAIGENGVVASARGVGYPFSPEASFVSPCHPLAELVVPLVFPPVAEASLW